MKRVKKSIFLILCIIMCASFVLIGCKGKNSDIELDEDGNIRPGSSVTTVNFWGYGDEQEVAVFQKLVKSFNAANPSISVKYFQKYAEGYGQNIRLTLGGSKGPDVFYAGDSDYKTLAEYGYLLPLDDFMAKSKEVVKEEMWESSVNRYLYDVETSRQDGANAKYWGVPKDIGPTVIFYNETYFKTAGVTVLSVDEEGLEAFNAGGKDDRGMTKADLGITGKVQEKGYFVQNGKKFFNNQIPMNWEETVACAKQVQDNSSAQYGYFTEWWFNYGWSVGGDCIEYIPTSDTAYKGGFYEFTLMDNTKNYVVADDFEGDFTVNGNKYSSRQIIPYIDKLVDATATSKTIRPEILAAESEGKLVELPSQREAFVEFVRLGQKASVIVDSPNGVALNGYGVTPSPTTIGGDAGKTSAFADGTIGMLVDGRWNVPNFRDKMDKKFAWDVAPLPIYRAYDADGNVTARGVDAGHSGSVALCINKKSTVANASWKFIEYISGRTGQSEQAKSGFAIPTQKDLANSDVFLQPTMNPKNAKAFARAAAVQTPGDWWYLRDSKWIDSWAGVLNGDVRKGEMTLSQFEASEEYKKTPGVLKTYTKK